jgi:hypothetical protein
MKMINDVTSSWRDCWPLSLCCKRENDKRERLLRGDESGYDSTDETPSRSRLSRSVPIPRQKMVEGDKEVEKETVTPGTTPTKDGFVNEQPIDSRDYV